MAPIPKVSIQKLDTQVAKAFSYEEEDDHNHKDEKKGHSAEDRYSSEPQKAHPTGELVIVTKFGGHVLHHLTSRLVNVTRQEGRLKT